MTANGPFPTTTRGMAQSLDKFDRTVAVVRQLGRADVSARDELARMLEADAKAENLTLILRAFEQHRQADLASPDTPCTDHPPVHFPPTPTANGDHECRATNRDSRSEEAPPRQPGDIGVSAFRRMWLLILTAQVAAAILLASWGPWLASEALSYMQSRNMPILEALALSVLRKPTSVAHRPAAGEPPAPLARNLSPMGIGLEHFPVKWVRFTVENATKYKARGDSVTAETALATGSVSGSISAEIGGTSTPVSEETPFNGPIEPAAAPAASAGAAAPASSDAASTNPTQPDAPEVAVVVPSLPPVEPLQASDFQAPPAELTAAPASPSGAEQSPVVPDHAAAFPLPEPAAQPDMTAPGPASGSDAPPEPVLSAIGEAHETPGDLNQAGEVQQSIASAPELILPMSPAKPMSAATPAVPLQFDSLPLLPSGRANGLKRDSIFRLLSEIAESLESKREVALERQRADALARELESVREEIDALRLRSATSWMAAPALSVLPGMPLHDPVTQATINEHTLPDDAAAAPAVRVKDQFPAAPPPMPPAEASGVSEQRILERAETLLRDRDISSARLLLERAAAMGSARGSYMLAQSYDPDMLSRWQVRGIRGDPVRARQLYEKARAVATGKSPESPVRP